jgi:hypothetical protein
MHITRTLVVAAATIIPVVAGSVAAAAPVGTPVHIVAHTDFAPGADPFEANLPGCSTGTVDDGPSQAHFTPWGGTYIGLKEFECDGGAAGFTIRLLARFGGGGSTGTWTVADAWGGLAGMRGSGSLVGISISDTAIDDIYTGSVR